MPTLFETPPKPIPGRQEKKPVKRSTMGPLTCFAVSPEGVRFETQEDAEEVILFLRQHLIVLLPPTFFTILLLFAPPTLFPLIGQALRLPVDIPPMYFIVGSLFWYLATFGFALVNFLRWFFNIYIVTNKRVVDIDFKFLLYKAFSEAHLTKIQDLTFTSGGIIAAFFNYGDVLVETAGEVPNIEFDAVPHPDRVVQTISELTGKAKGTSL